MLAASGFGGILLTVFLTLLAQQLIQLPVLSIMGSMVTAILLGIALRSSAASVVVPWQSGAAFTAKYILRAGIVLMGVRLNIRDIVAVGWPALVLDVAVIIFAVAVIHLLGRRLAVERKLTTLIAVGTGICGAAAISAVAPLIKARDDEVAISITTIAVLGTVFTIAYTAFLPLLGLSPHQFGAFAGSTLHELAHVIAAAAPDGPASSDTAILVKLGRVAMLAPAGMLIARFYAARGCRADTVAIAPVPWFVLGFFALALLNTWQVFDTATVRLLSSGSIFLLTMAMAGLGLNVKLADFRRVGLNPPLVCLIGSVLLSVLGRILIWLLDI
jgi:uncharacterized integral membrane protein (TIGR00698 family)